MFYIDSVGITTVNMDRVKRAAKYIWFCHKYLGMKIQIRNSKVKSLLDSGIEFNLIKKA